MNNFVKKYRELYEECNYDLDKYQKLIIPMLKETNDIEEAFAIVSILYIENQPLGVLSRYEQDIECFAKLRDMGVIKLIKKITTNLSEKELNSCFQGLEGHNTFPKKNKQYRVEIENFFNGEDNDYKNCFNAEIRLIENIDDRILLKSSTKEDVIETSMELIDSFWDEVNSKLGYKDAEKHIPVYSYQTNIKKVLLNIS